MDWPTEDRFIFDADGTLRFVLGWDRKAHRLGLAFWLADGYKPAGYPFGKTVSNARASNCNTDFTQSFGEPRHEYGLLRSTYNI